MVVERGPFQHVLGEGVEEEVAQAFYDAQKHHDVGNVGLCAHQHREIYVFLLILYVQLDAQDHVL